MSAFESDEIFTGTMSAAPGEGCSTAGVEPTMAKLILLEDDPLILDCTREALSSAGYDVLSASTGVEALALLSEAANVAAMLVDVRLRHPPDGWEVARRARFEHPGLAIIYSTTSTAAAYRQQAVEGSILLEKPYTLDRAVAAVRAAVSNGSTNGAAFGDRANTGW